MLQDILSGQYIWIIALLIAITIHEFSHALMADRLGDPTARLAGRLTLNPLAHLDPIGTIMILLVNFGWGKPVPFDPFNLRNPRQGSALISFAGPASNLLLALLLSILLRLTPLIPLNIYAIVHPFTSLLIPIIVLNVSLAIFNLLPIHPLDGGKILVGILPEGSARNIEEFLNRNGTILLIILIFPFFGTSLVAKIITPIIYFILSILIPGLSII